jgi:SAM-dependent methyltransferase
VDADQIKEQARGVWGKGDYAGLSEVLRPAAEALCDACAVSAGQEVLDVAAGDGNFALACAAEGASVVASDLAPGMVEQGRARSEGEGYDIEWVEADAEELPFEDGRFDCVGSVFGAMIAPRPEVVAKELFRVVRPGNTVGMTAWSPDSPAVELFSIGRRYAPQQDPDAGKDSAGMPNASNPHLPERWADRDFVQARFDRLAASLEMEERTLPWQADSPEEFVAAMERHAPPQAAARERMPPELYARMRKDSVELARSWAGGDGPFSVDVGYLMIVARKRG